MAAKPAYQPPASPYGAWQLPPYLANDPSLMAFLAVSGLQQSTDDSDIAKATENAGTRSALGSEDIQDQYEQAQEQTAGGFESRGTLRSGEALEAQARLDRARARAEGLNQLNKADTISGLQSSAARQGNTREQAFAQLLMSSATDQGTTEASATTPAQTDLANPITDPARSLAVKRVKSKPAPTYPNSRNMN